MSLQCGIVGLPNVGKSSLFNALGNATADAENFPFCTIDPNVGMVPVPDPRLYKIYELTGSAKVTPTMIEFVDIAGLVRGASEGKGKGNAFLSHIRRVDLIVHVVRCFEDENVIHVEGDINPERDIHIIEDELILKDLESVEKREDTLSRQAKSGDKETKRQLEVVKRLKQHLEEGYAARSFEASEDDRIAFRDLDLLSDKQVMYACNVSEEDLKSGNKHVEWIREHAKQQGDEVVMFCARIESEMAELDKEERADFLEEMGLESGGLQRLINAAYKELGLITFFTTGPKETRAWELRKGSTALEAAGKIHSDFARGFIRAETISYEEFVACGSEKAAREAGKLRQEGKDYIVKDGDVILFRFNV